MSIWDTQCAHSRKGHLHMGRKRARATSTVLDGCAWSPGGGCVRGGYGNRLWRSLADEGCVDCVEIISQSQEARVLATLRFQGQLTFPSRRAIGRFAVAMESTGDMEARLIILDVMDANVIKSIQLPIHLCGVPCCEAAVDPRGTACVLMQCDGSVWAWQESDTNDEDQWTELVNPEIPAKNGLERLSSKSGMFISSPILASCFSLIHVTLDTHQMVTFEHVIYDIDSGWASISVMSRILSLNTKKTINIDANSHFYVCRNGNWCVIFEKSLIVFLSTDLVDENEENSLHVYDMDAEVINATWKPRRCDESNNDVEGMDTLTVLLSNGHLVNISLGITRSLELVEVGEMMKMINQVVWIDNQENPPKLLAFEDSSPVLLTIERVDTMEPTVSSISFDNRWCIQPAHLESINMLWRRHRFWLRSDRQALEEALHPYCESSSSKNRHGLLNMLRLFLGQSSDDSVHDIVFTLLSIIHHQGMSVIDNGVASSAAAIFLDLLVTRIVSIGCSDRAQFATLLMAAPSAFSSRNARRFYYRHQLKCLYLRVLQDEDRQQDYISAENAFLDMYSPTIVSLAYKVAVMEANKFALAMNQCKHICELLVNHQVKSLLEDMHCFKHTIALSCNDDDVYSEMLMVVIVSYSMACTSLCIDGFLINVPRLLILLRSNGEFTPEKTFRKEFLIPLLQVLNTNVIVDSKISQETISNELSYEWSIQQALQMAIDTQTAQRLFSFCVESGSSSSNKCIQKMTEAYEMFLSKNIYSNQGHVINELEMAICETYLSEMITILQHLPLVRDFQHAAPHDSNLKAEVFVESEWKTFLKGMHSGPQDEKSHSPVKTTPELAFSSREVHWQYRMMYLKKSLMWHLQNQVNRARRDNHDDMPELLARLFLLEFLQDAHNNSDDTKLIQKFLLKSQDALGCSSSITSLIERLSVSSGGDIFYKRKKDVKQSCFRFEKLLRTIAVVTWSLWVRDRCTYCCRFIEQIKTADGTLLSHDATNRVVGSMAATSALQLNVIGLVIGKVDQISFLQTSLLEDAAQLCPRKAAAVLGWGFPTDKINARYLKRYKAVRHLLKSDMETNKSNDGEDLEEIENRCQFIQSHVKRKIRDFIANGKYQQGSGMKINAVISSPKGSELKRRWAMEIDVFVDCCCTPDFQHLVWALIRKRFRCNEQSEVNTVTTREATSINQKHTIQTAVYMRPTTSLLSKDTSMSREEILALMRTQQQEFDMKVQSHFSSQQNERPSHDAKEQLKASPQSEDENKSLTDKSQLISKFRAFTRNLSDRHQSFPDLDAQRRKEMNINETTLQRGQSVQNVLKLLQLRKNTEETTADPRQVVGHLFANTANQKMATEDADPRKTETMEKKENISLMQRKQSVRPSVFSLKFEEDINGAHLKLLRCGNGKQQAVQLRTKQFEVPEHARSSIRKHEHIVNENKNHDVVALRMASVQTNTFSEPLNNVKSVTWADIDTNRRGKSMEEHYSPDTRLKNDDQNEQISETAKTVDKNLGLSSITTQCIKNSPHLHKSTQVKTKTKTTAVPTEPCAYHNISTHIQLNDERRKKFMQVVQSSKSRPPTSSVLEVLNDDDNDGNYILIDSEEQKMVSSDPTEANKNAKKEVHSVNDEASLRARMLKYQAIYREQVSLRNAPATEKKNGNAHAFAGLRDDMQRMKQRLHDLEHFADTIDEDFKDSHHKLLHIGDSQDAQTQAKVLETIDSVLRETSEFDSTAVDGSSKTPASRILERKAASDMVAAKNLLAKIERLALAVGNDDTG